MLEVWDLKEEACREVKGMNIEQAIQTRINNSITTAKEMGFRLTGVSEMANCYKINTMKQHFYPYEEENRSSCRGDWPIAPTRRRVMMSGAVPTGVLCIWE